MNSDLKSRLPAFVDLSAVYSVIVVLFYGWTLVAFLWKVPSWLNYLTVGEMLTILAYSFATNWIESLLLLGLLLLATVLLPPKFLLTNFVNRGSVIVLCLLGSGMTFYARFIEQGSSTADSWPVWLAVTLAILSVCLVMVENVKAAGAAVSWLAEQLTVFLYILLPLSALSAAVVLARNIF